MTLATTTNGQHVDKRQPEQEVSTTDASSERPTSLGTGRQAWRFLSMPSLSASNSKDLTLPSPCL